jgi:hypothetical protein
VTWGELIGRLLFAAIGLLLIHDAVWWTNSWFFGRAFGGWWKRQTETAQTLHRLWNGAFGFVIIIAAAFAPVASR